MRAQEPPPCCSIFDGADIGLSGAEVTCAFGFDRNHTGVTVPIRAASLLHKTMRRLRRAAGCASAGYLAGARWQFDAASTIHRRGCPRSAWIPSNDTDRPSCPDFRLFAPRHAAPRRIASRRSQPVSPPAVRRNRSVRHRAGHARHCAPVPFRTHRGPARSVPRRPSP